MAMTVLTRGGLAACLLSFGLLTITGALPGADDQKANLKVGDQAPDFQATDDQGKEWKLSDHVGKKVIVVYFYPADLTGGCTKQACGFRDDFKKLADKGVEVVGISGDSVKNHQLFKEVHKLNFTLLADEDGTIAKKFGVPVGPGGEFKTKDLDGNAITLKRGVTAQRWTFAIDKEGKIAYKNSKVNPTQDSKQILKVFERSEK
jgi:peroxiredoxin Q/BCP